MQAQSGTLLAAATTVLASSAVQLPESTALTIFAKGTNAVVSIEVLSPAGDWHVLDTYTFTTAAVQAPKVYVGVYGAIRANATANTGTVTVSFLAATRW